VIDSPRAKKWAYQIPQELELASRYQLVAAGELMYAEVTWESVACCVVVRCVEISVGLLRDAGVDQKGENLWEKERDCWANCWREK
jgi:hypothetical protein